MSQLVITRGTDCDSRGDGLIDSRELVMPRNKLEVIDVPNGATLCWRRDRNPEKPAAGVWTGWTKATLLPGRQRRGEPVEQTKPSTVRPISPRLASRHPQGIRGTVK